MLFDLQTWENDRKVIEKRLDDLNAEKGDLSVHKEELNRLLDNICASSTNEQEAKTRLGDLTRQVLILRTNENVLARRYLAAQGRAEFLQKVRKRCNKHKNKVNLG